MKSLTILVLVMSVFEIGLSLYIIASGVVPARTMAGVALETGVMVLVVVWAVVALMSERK